MSPGGRLSATGLRGAVPATLAGCLVSLGFHVFLPGASWRASPAYE